LFVFLSLFFLLVIVLSGFRLTVSEKPLLYLQTFLFTKHLTSDVGKYLWKLSDLLFFKCTHQPFICGARWTIAVIWSN
jgi:hypothetical protein